MKNKRFWAALLTAAMVLTSSSINVAAMTLENDVNEFALLSDENSDEISPENVLMDEAFEELETLNDEDDEELLVESETLDVENSENDVVFTTQDEDVPFEGATEPSVYFEPGAEILSINHTYGNAKLNDLVDDDGVVIIPKETKVIPCSDRLFDGATKVKEVDFVEGSTVAEITISENAFRNSGLVKFYSPDNYKTVSDNTFTGCTNLATFDFHNISAIGNMAFDGCTALGTGTISRGTKINSIGKYAFRGTGFERLDFETIGSEVDAITLDEHAFEGCISLKTVIIPKKITKVPDYCFSGCSALEEIQIIGNTPVNGEIGAYAFKDCIALKTLGVVEKDEKGNIKNIIDSLNVTKIGDYAFSGCKKIKVAVLPKSVIEIGDSVFSGCESLVEIYFRYFNDSTGIADNGPNIHVNAFPDLKVRGQAVIYGYDGIVKEYAQSEEHKFKDYISLIEPRNYAATTASGRILAGNSVNPEKGKAKPGTKVTIKLSPKGDPVWRLQRNDLKDLNGNLQKKDFKFVKGDDKSQTFEFEMPYKDVLFDVDDGFYQDSWLKNAAFSHDVGEYEKGGLNYKWRNGQYEVDKPGYKGQIEINAKATVNGKERNLKLGQWMFVYTTSDPAVATVTEDGVLTSKGVGYTNITATYRIDSRIKQSFTVHVGTDASISVLSLNSVEAKPGVNIVRTYDDVTYKYIKVVEIPRNVVGNAEKKFDITLEAKESEGSQTSLNVDATWSSGNTSFVTLKEARNDTNKNTVTVKSGVCGETYIKVTYDTGKKDGDGNKIILYAYLIVRIVDMTPRVTEDDITVNVNFDVDNIGGTPISITPYEGKAIDLTYPIVMKRGNGTTRLDSYNGLKVILPQNAGDDYRLIINKNGGDQGLKPGAKRIYQGNDKLFIAGRYVGETTEFLIPLNRVIIINDPLKLDAKMEGKINLYYNSFCYDPIHKVTEYKDEIPMKDDEKEADYVERYIGLTVGKVKVTNNIVTSQAEINFIDADKGVQLWSVDTYKAWNGSNVEAATTAWKSGNDKFKNNFEVSWAYDGQNDLETGRQDFTIVRSNNILATELKNNKPSPVTNGYIAIYFRGYTQPVVQKVSIPLGNKAPSYAMTVSSTIESSYNKNGTFRFQIVDKSTKETVMDQTSATASLDTANMAGFSSVAFVGKDVVLTKAEGTYSGKKTAVVNVARMNWDSEFLKTYPVSYKFTVNYVDKNPVAKINSSTVTVNRWFRTINGEAEIYLDQQNCELTLKADTSGKYFNYIGNDNMRADADKIKFTVDVVPNYKNKKSVKVSFDPNNLPSKGTYKFSYVPQYMYVSGNAVNLKEQKISVRVLDNQPILKLGSTSFVFNIDYPDLESKEVVATFSNLPTGTKIKDVSVNMAGVKATYVKGNVDDQAAQNAIIAGLTMKQEYNQKTKKQMLTFKMKAPTVKLAYNAVYDLEGITIDGIEAKKIRITVKGIKKEPTVSVSAKDKINTIDDTSCVKYKTKFNGLTSPDVKAVRVYDYEGAVNESDFFRAVIDPDDKNIINVYAKHDPANRLYNKNYSLVLKYIISNTDDSLNKYTKKLTIKPVQKVPNISTNTKKAAFHAGVADGDRIKRVVITKTSEIKTHIIGVKVSDSNSELLKHAFVIENNGYQDDDIYYPYNNVPKNLKRIKAGTVTISCVAPELLVAGKVYNLELETTFANQFIKLDSNGNVVYEKYANGVQKKDAQGNPIPVKIAGSKFKVPVVVYK